MNVRVQFVPDDAPEPGEVLFDLQKVAVMAAHNKGSTEFHADDPAQGEEFKRLVAMELRRFARERRRTRKTPRAPTIAPTVSRRPAPGSVARRRPAGPAARRRAVATAATTAQENRHRPQGRDSPAPPRGTSRCETRGRFGSTRGLTMR